MKNIFYKIVIFAFLLIILCSCAKKDPVETIIDHHQNHIGEVLDYAYNNIEQTKDIIFLENELKSCDLAMIDIKQSYYGQIAACKAKTDYWRLATFGLGMLLIALIVLKLKRWF